MTERIIRRLFCVCRACVCVCVCVSTVMRQLVSQNVTKNNGFVLNCVGWMGYRTRMTIFGLQ